MSLSSDYTTNWSRGWRIAFVALLALVTWLSLASEPDPTGRGFAVTRWIAELLFGSATHHDKIAHFLAYASLGGSAALGSFRILDSRFTVVTLIIAYGLALEGAQGLLGTRVADFTDAIANAAGACTGFAGGAMLQFLAMKWRR